MLDDHALKLSLAQKQSIDSQEAQIKKDKLLKKRVAGDSKDIVDNEEAQSNKLMVKNLAFEATVADIRELFKQHGALKKVRLPKKVNSQNHRGFGFVEFTNTEQALQAFKAL
jgi:RNA recognition motif-containing protein